LLGYVSINAHKERISAAPKAGNIRS